MFGFFFFFFFFYVEETRTDTRPLLGGGGELRGSAGNQPTKTSTMTDSAVIERGPGTDASDTPGPDVWVLKLKIITKFVNMDFCFEAHPRRNADNSNFHFPRSMYF